ncbi:MAG: hypothetical protein P4L99_19985 [Chthoniobacter sp.]|nr:hypothetical protein [Chthoniobacter sp.]
MKLVWKHPRIANHDAARSAQVQQAVFSIACDKIANGESLEVGLMPRCPSCGHRRPASWSQIFSAREWPLPAVEHVAWNAMTAEEKAALIDMAIEHYFDQGK